MVKCYIRLENNYTPCIKRFLTVLLLGVSPTVVDVSIYTDIVFELSTDTKTQTLMDILVTSMNNVCKPN